MNGDKVQLLNQDAASGKQPGTHSPMGVTCMRVKKGALTEAHRHETECLLVVIEGAWRVHLGGRAVTVRKNEMLHIPPQHEHFAEALADTVALSISTRAGEWAGCGPFLHEDADQYLWGV